jgi:hypothetical protein
MRAVEGETVTIKELLQAKRTEILRANWKIAGGGYGIHWPDVDEDLSIEGLMRGLPAPGSAALDAALHSSCGR